MPVALNMVYCLGLWFEGTGGRQNGFVFAMKLRKLALGVALAAVVGVAGVSMPVVASEEGATVLNPIKRGVENKVLENGPTVTVATYNMGAARVSDIDTIVTAIKALDADIIALDEVDNKTQRSGQVDQAKYIADKLGLHYVFGRAIDFEGGQYGVAILSRHPITTSEVVPLPSGDPKVDEARIVLAAEIAVPGFETPIVFMNTHLDYKEDHSIQKTQVQRINDLAVANVALNNIKDFTTKIKILAGDFNDTYNSANVAELSRYWNLVTSDDPNEMRSWPAANPMADLDHIFTSRGQIWDIKSLEVLQGNARDIDWSGASDHTPIVVKLQLKEQ